METLINYDFNVDHCNPHDRKRIYELAKEMKFNIEQKVQKSPRNESVMRLLESPAIISSGLQTKCLPENPEELFERLKLLLQAKKAGNNSDKIKEETVMILDKLMKYKWISKKQHEQFFLKVIYYTQKN